MKRKTEAEGAQSDSALLYSAVGRPKDVIWEKGETLLTTPQLVSSTPLWHGKPSKCLLLFFFADGKLVSQALPISGLLQGKVEGDVKDGSCPRDFCYPSVWAQLR